MIKEDWNDLQDSCKTQEEKDWLEQIVTMMVTLRQQVMLRRIHDKTNEM